MSRFVVYAHFYLNPAAAEPDAGAGSSRTRRRGGRTRTGTAAAISDEVAQSRASRGRGPGHGRGWRRRRALASRRPCLAPHPYNYRVPLRVQQEDRVYVRPKQITPASRLGGA